MPNLTDLHSWERCVPNLGANRQQEKPFYFLVKGNLTVVELDAYRERWTALLTENASTEKLAEFLGEFIRFGDEPLTVGGEAVVDLVGYLKLLERFAASTLLAELFGWVPYVNSMEGARALFFEQRSGGSAFMTLPTGARIEATRRR